MKHFLSLFLIAFALISCAPQSREATAAEQAKIDSVFKASDSIATEKADIEAGKEIMRKENCKKLWAKLAAAQDKLEDIKQWKLGRSAAKKEKQLEEQYKIIADLKEELKSCQ